MLQVKKQGFIINLILSAISLGENFLLKFVPTDWVEVKLSIKAAAADLREIVKALFDDNPKNKEQVLEILRGSAQKDAPELLRLLMERAQGQVKSVELKAFLALLTQPAINTVIIMTDNIAENEAQLKAMLDENFKSKETRELLFEGIIVPLLTSRINDAFLLNFLLSAIKGALLEENV